MPRRAGNHKQLIGTLSKAAASSISFLFIFFALPLLLSLFLMQEMLLFLLPPHFLYHLKAI
ncbi:MAG TPA: hypothetical protein VFY41_02780 [Nitrososphaeraceae archaeon]|nr:hypothetical protein [Nitrososphaeraceae archaeon]